MASKAHRCGDELVLQQILQTCDPQRHKKLGRSLDEKAVRRHWNAEQKWHVQLTGARAKFLQNPQLAVRLLQTGSKPIAEASPSDTVFGVGLAPNNARAQDPAQWRGSNLLGEALMQVRQE